jgi:hypothetical protein
MDTLYYDSIETLINALKLGIIDPAIEKYHELRILQVKELKNLSVNDLLAKEKK